MVAAPTQRFAQRYRPASTGESGTNESGPHAEIPAHAERAVELARTTGLGGPRAGWIAACWVDSLVLLGRWSEVEQLISELADLLDHPSLEGELAGSWGVALIRQGRLDEARPLIAHARALQARGNWFESHGWLVAAVVMFDAAEGDNRAAEAHIDEMVDRQEPSLDGNSYLVATASAAVADRAPTGPAGTHDDTSKRNLAAVTRWIGWMDATEHDGGRPTIEQRLHRDHAMAQLQRLSGRSDPSGGRNWRPAGVESGSATTRPTHSSATPKRSSPATPGDRPPPAELRRTCSQPPTPWLTSSTRYRC